MSELADGILILDYGSQYTLLIARRLRELGVYTEIWPFDDERLEGAVGAGRAPARGLILSGGPSSVRAPGAPDLDPALLEIGVPLLGICYGMQLLADAVGARVEPDPGGGEYGRAHIIVDDARGPLAPLDAAEPLDVWMSHGDSITDLPEGLQALARTEGGTLAAVADIGRDLYGLQFHPEVEHTPAGGAMLAHFARMICGIEGRWEVADLLEESTARIAARVADDERVICGLSGGVDSSVVAALLQRALGERLACVFVDTGLLRHREADLVREVFEEHFGVDLRVVDAREEFLEALDGVRDPERKRKVIGERFVRIFERQARQIPGARFLAQGTLYPDVIESVSVGGPSATIKSHHNVGGLPEQMDLELIEPLRELFKDEVRRLGRALGLPDHIVDRHPFPGPGLAIRILGEVTAERLERLRAADHIFISMLRDEGLYDEVWQAFAVLIPVRTVGVMGDRRTYDQLVALRAVTSTDGMTADRSHLPLDFLGRASDRIINEVPGVNRVVYDISSKPPATIEWE